MKAKHTFNSLTTLLILLTLVFFSCSKSNKEYKVEVDFLINDEELQSLNFDYSEEELELYKNDPDKVFYTMVGDEVEFSQNEAASSINKSKWYLNDEEWVGKDNQAITLPSFNYTFNLPGLYKIKLVVDDKHVITKFVRAIDGKSKDSFLVTNQDSMPTTDEPEMAIKSEEENIEFVADNMNPNKWEAVLFEDVSVLKTDIKRRVWDFGDGTVIPTSGNKVKYSYSKSGTFEVKLCLNLSDKCFSQKIKVNEKNEMAHLKVTESSPSESKSTPSTSKSKNITGSDTKASKKQEATPAVVNTQLDTEKPEINEVKLAAPTVAKMGTPIRFLDLSSPAEAIQFRSWYINDAIQPYHQKSVDMVFDEPGEYRVKMCLNYLSKYCEEVVVVVEDINQILTLASNAVADNASKKSSGKVGKTSTTVGILNLPSDKLGATPSFVPISPVKPDGSFFCQSFSKTGLKASYRCSSNKEFYDGVAVIKMTPNTDVELHNAKIYGNELGYVDVIISDDEKSQVGILKKVQVLPGQTSLEFAELALTLKKGKTYELTIIPLAQSTKMLKKIALENSKICEVPSYDDNKIEIEYRDDIKVLYDIKYCY